MLLYLSDSGGHTCFPNLGCSHLVATFSQIAEMVMRRGCEGHVQLFEEASWRCGTLKITIYCNQVYGGVHAMV